MTQPPNLRIVTEDQHTWDELDGKPSTFPPTTHTHTKDDVGLGNVDNTSDAAKPVSTATRAALDGKAASSHTHTPDEVGLGNVDNTSDAAKPISTATQTALDGKEPDSWSGSQSAYDALGTKDPERTYYIL